MRPRVLTISRPHEPRPITATLTLGPLGLASAGAPLVWANNSTPPSMVRSDAAEGVDDLAAPRAEADNRHFDLRPAGLGFGGRPVGLGKQLHASEHGQIGCGRGC